MTAENIKLKINLLFKEKFLQNIVNKLKMELEWKKKHFKWHKKTLQRKMEWSIGYWALDIIWEWSIEHSPLWIKKSHEADRSVAEGRYLKY